MSRRRAALARRIPWTLVVFLVAIWVPWLGSRYDTFLGTEIAIEALFAVSLNLLLGTTGLVSFGHVAYFGVGAYVCGILMKTYALPFVIAFPAAGIGAAGFALVFGYFCVRLSAIYFAMLTLAFSQIVWAICFKWNAVTGGDQGLPEVPYPNLDWIAGIPGLGDTSISDRFYLLTLTLVALSLAALRQVVRSPFGRMLTTIRDNPERAAFIGLNVRAYELAAFVVAGAFAGTRRRALRHLQSRRLRRLCLLVEIRRGDDHDHPRRHELFLGAAGRRAGAGVAQSGDHLLYPVLAVRARHDPAGPALRLPRRHRRRARRRVPPRAAPAEPARCLTCAGCARALPASSPSTG